MKKFNTFKAFLFFTISLSLSLSLSAQSYSNANTALRNMFGSLDWNPVGTYTSTGGNNSTPEFLYTMSAHIADDNFYAPMSQDTSNLDNFFYMYEAMYYAAKDTSLWERADSLSTNAFQSYADTVPLLMFNFDFLEIKDTALKSGDYFQFDTVNGVLLDHPSPIGDPFDLREVFAAASSIEHHNFSNVTYAIDSRFFLTDSRNDYKKTNYPENQLRIKFGDGSGWHSFDLSSPSYITINYPSAGSYLTEVEIVEVGVVVNRSKFKTSILADNPSIPPDSEIDINGLNVGIYNSCDNGNQQMDDRKFVVYLEGIDIMDFFPGLNRGVSTIYEDMIKDEDLVELRNFGYSFVIVDWKNSRKDMRSNAMHVVELLDYLKCTYPNDHEIVVIGESMGGVVGRYALTFMESSTYQNGYEVGGSFREPCMPELMHKTRLFMTFDSPHQGANVPLSLQEFYKSILKGASGLAGMNKVLTAPVRMVLGHIFNFGLGSDAVEQLLLYHADTKDPFCSTSTYNCYDAHNKHYNFFAELNDLGNYPRFCKLMALSNGSISGSPQTRAYSHAERIAGDALFNFNSEIYARVLHFIKVPVFGANINLRTNPQGDGKLAEFGWGTWGIKIKVHWFGLKVKVGLISNGSNEFYGKDLISYCTNAGGMFDLNGLQPGSQSFSNTPEPWPGRSFPLFKFSASNNGNGSYELNAEVGIPWVAQAGLEVSLFSDGFHFGFIPVKSALDWGVVHEAPLSPDIENWPWPGRVDSSRFDVIGGISSLNPNNRVDDQGGVAEAYDRNRDHVNVENEPVSNRPGAVDLTTCGFPTYILNREIGDEILWLNNRELAWSARFESEFDMTVNAGTNNPHYEYQTVAPNINMLYRLGGFWGGFYSKENPFTVEPVNPVNGHQPIATFKFGNNFVYNTPFPVDPAQVNPLNEQLFICCFRSEQYKNQPVDNQHSTEIWRNSSLEVYPNPFENSISLVFDHNKDEPASILIHDAHGKKIEHYTVHLSSRATIFKKFQLEVAPGIYFIRWVNNRGVTVDSKKIIAR